MRLARPLLLAVCLLLLVATSASAAVRNASPSGVGASPCNPTPCSLTTAVNGAAPGDQVVMASGTYKSASPPVINKAIDVGGAMGATTVVELTGDNSLQVSHVAARLHDLRVVHGTPTMAYALDLANGTVERLYVDGTDGSSCTMARGLIRDSVCFEGLQVSPSGAGSYQATVTNVTANPLSIGAHSGANLAASVTNTLALPNGSEFASKSGLLINVSAGASASALLTNSNYNSADTSLSSGTEFQYTPAGTNGNQTALPVLVNRAAGDFRQLASSPTIDAGTTTVDPLGTFDLLGAARLQPRCIGGTPIPDIGAYEFTPTEACTVPISAPGPGPATPPIKFGKLKRNPAKGTATLEVKVPAAGQLKVTGKGVVVRTQKAAGPKTLKVVLKAKGKKAKALRRNGKVTLQPKFSFTTTGGSAAPVTRKVTLRLNVSR